MKKLTCFKINITRNTTEKVELYIDDFYTTKDSSGTEITTIYGSSIYIWDKLPYIRPLPQNKNWFLKDHYVLTV